MQERPVTRDTTAGSRPRWSRLSEIPGVVTYPSHLRRTLTIAVVVGTLLVVINQLSMLTGGHWSALLWIRVALDFVVPFCVSNVGVLSACRDPRPTLR